MSSHLLACWALTLTLTLPLTLHLTLTRRLEHTQLLSRALGGPASTSSSAQALAASTTPAEERLRRQP